LLYISNSLDTSSVANCLISISNDEITLTRSRVVNIRAKNRFDESNDSLRTVSKPGIAWNEQWSSGMRAGLAHEKERERVFLRPRSLALLATQCNAAQRPAASCMIVYCTHVQLHRAVTSHMITLSHYHIDHTDHTAYNSFFLATSYAHRESTREPRDCLLW